MRKCQTELPKVSASRASEILGQEQGPKFGVERSKIGLALLLEPSEAAMLFGDSLSVGWVSGAQPTE